MLLGVVVLLRRDYRVESFLFASCPAAALSTELLNGLQRQQQAS
jgi:hypothetical protein